MQAPRLNEVLARVVAWHNRHPLARRISASQVHSIGEVLLPFASAQPPAPAAPPPPHLPTIDELLAAEALSPEVAHFDALVRRAAHPEPTAADTPPPEAAPPPQAPSAPHDATGPDDGDETALDMPLLLPPGAADAGAADPAQDAMSGGVDLALADAQPAPAAPHRAAAPADAALGASAGPTTADTGGPEPVARPIGTPATAGDPARRSWLQRLLARLGAGRSRHPRLQPAFSMDFIWPLSPARVGRWARRHGQPQSLAPADWPRRVVDTDKARLAGLRQRGLAHSVSLHVLTAAIGVGDRRIRVLLDTDGAVLGPRAYSRARVATAAGLLVAAVLGAGWARWHPAPAAGAEVPAPAPAASAPASAPQATASAAVDAAALAASAPAPAASVAGHGVQAPGADAVGPSEAPAIPHLAVAASATPPGAASSASATDPAHPAESVASAPQHDIRPVLSAEARQAARAQAAALRGEAKPEPAAAAAPAPVYAVVSLPQARRDAAARALLLMQAAGRRLPPPAPEHGELMASQGSWRAAWWPFATLADAERARVLLAGRGVKAEVVEF